MTLADEFMSFSYQKTCAMHIEQKDLDALGNYFLHVVVAKPAGARCGMIAFTAFELCFFLWCGAYTLGLYLRGCLRLGSPLKQMPTREVLFVRCLRGMPTQGTVTNFSHIR